MQTNPRKATPRRLGVTAFRAKPFFAKRPQVDTVLHYRKCFHRHRENSAYHNRYPTWRLTAQNHGCAPPAMLARRLKSNAVEASHLAGVAPRMTRCAFIVLGGRPAAPPRRRIKHCRQRVRQQAIGHSSATAKEHPIARDRQHVPHGRTFRTPFPR